MQWPGHLVLCQTLVLAALSSAGDRDTLNVRLFWGHTATQPTPFHIRLSAREVSIGEVAGISLEGDDHLADAVCAGHCGDGDVDGVEFPLLFAPTEVKPAEKIHHFWTDYFAQCDAETARRLQQDPAYRPDSRVLAAGAPLPTRVSARNFPV